MAEADKCLSLYPALPLPWSQSILQACARHCLQCPSLLHDYQNLAAPYAVLLQRLAVDLGSLQGVLQQPLCRAASSFVSSIGCCKWMPPPLQIEPSESSSSSCRPAAAGHRSDPGPQCCHQPHRPVQRRLQPRKQDCQTDNLKMAGAAVKWRCQGLHARFAGRQSGGCIRQVGR